MKILSILLLFTMCMVRVYGQSKLPLRADTVTVEKTGGVANFQVKDVTKDSLGIVYNIGNGVYRNKRAKKLNDSTLVVGNDTISLAGGIGSATQITDTSFVIGVDTIRIGGIDSAYTRGYLIDSAFVREGGVEKFIGIEKDGNGNTIQLLRYNTYASRHPYLYGDTMWFGGNSWAVELFGGGQNNWPTLLTTHYGKNKQLVGAAGDDLNGLIKRSFDYVQGNSTNRIFITDLAYIDWLGVSSTCNPCGAAYYGENDPVRIRRKIVAGYRAYTANYFLDTGWHSFKSLGLPGTFAEKTDSVHAKSQTIGDGAVFGTGTYNFVKPANRTSVVIGHYGSDGTTFAFGTINVYVRGKLYISKTTDSTNNRGSGNTLFLHRGMNYDAIILHDLPADTCTITVIATGNDCYLDYYGCLVQPEATNKALFHNNKTYVRLGSLQMAGLWSIFSNSIVDTANHAMLDAISEFANYPVFVTNINSNFGLTDYASDFAHPGAGGSALITNYYKNNLTSTYPRDGNYYVPTAGAGGGIASLNSLTGATQTFAVGTSGTDFAISSSGTTHTFNIPDASSTARGLITVGTQTIVGTKTIDGTLRVKGAADKNLEFYSFAGDVYMFSINDARNSSPTNTMFNAGTNFIFQDYTTGSLVERARFSGNDFLLGSPTNNGVGRLQITGKITVSTHAIASNSDTALTWDRTTNEYKITQVPNFFNSNLRSTANRLHSFADNNLVVDSIKQFTFAGHGNAFNGRKRHMGFLFDAASASDVATNGSLLVSNVYRNAADNADSVAQSLKYSANGVELKNDNLIAGRLSRVLLNNSYGLFRGSDSVLIGVMLPKANADSIAAIGPWDATLRANTVYKIPHQQILRSTLTHDFGTIGAASSSTTTTTVTGAAIGDIVHVTTSDGAGMSNGEIYDAWVSAANTVSVRRSNFSSGSAISASRDYNIMVLKY